MGPSQRQQLCRLAVNEASKLAEISGLANFNLALFNFHLQILTHAFLEDGTVSHSGNMPMDIDSPIVGAVPV